MSAVTEPIVAALVLGIVVSIAVAVVVILRLGADRPERVPVRQARPDKRAQRFDDVIASSPLLRRAVEVTANLAERKGVLGSVERALRAADVPVRPAELILANVVAVVVLPVAAVAVTGSSTNGIMVLLFAGGFPALAVRFIAARRRKRFGAQLADTLITLAGSLRAGRSVGQAMDALSREMPDPMGRELRKVVAEVRLGRSLHDTLSDAADRVGSADFRWAILAMQIQSEVGGNLAELLDQVASTMRERSRLKGEIKALTAEGRASAMMLVVMVPALGGVMWVMNPDYMGPLFSTGMGQFLLGLSTVMITGGYLWMSSMVKIDV